MKWQQSKEQWREVFCILDQSRLWFHCPVYEGEYWYGQANGENSTAVSEGDGAAIGGGSFVNSGLPTPSLFSGPGAIGASLPLTLSSKSYISYIDLVSVPLRLKAIYFILIFNIF